MTNIHRLRLACERRYATQAATLHHPVPNLHAFLCLPLKERLILLALADRCDHKTIQAALPFAKQSDVRLTSPGTRAALTLLHLALASPKLWIDPQADDVERQLTNIFYPSTALLLFGELVPPELEVLGLQGRAIMYCLLVEQMERDAVQALLGVSEWKVKQTIRLAMEGLKA